MIRILHFTIRYYRLESCKRNLDDSCKDNIMHESKFEVQTLHFSTFKICELQSLDYFFWEVTKLLRAH